MKLIFDYNEMDLGVYNFITHTIKINPKVILKSYLKYETDFFTLLMHVINHEFLHHILLIEHGEQLSSRLDNLTYKKQKNENIWNYWLS